MSKKIIALDLGTTCGWAVFCDDKISSGSIKLDAKKANRFVAFRSMLEANYTSAEFIFFEDVKRHVGTKAAQCYGGFKAILEAFAHEHIITMVGIGVGTIKKHATGKGNAGKTEMKAWARKELGREPVDDNEADALALLDYALRANKGNLK